MVAATLPKQYETRKQVPGFERFVVPFMVESSNTFRPGAASAFVRIKMSARVYLNVSAKCDESFISVLEGGSRPKQSEIMHDGRGFLELRLDDYPHEDNAKALNGLAIAASMIRALARKEELRISEEAPEEIKQEPVLVA